MSERNCGGCHLWKTQSPAAFEGECCYFPPQLGRELGRLVNVRPITTREEGCHIGYRPRTVSPVVVPMDDERRQELIELMRETGHGSVAQRGGQ